MKIEKRSYFLAATCQNYLLRQSQSNASEIGVPDYLYVRKKKILWIFGFLFWGYTS